ncbi:hypothetical protein L6R52_18215 [Myxococcota bacterium]|nr:hypothetical protein [Myxococcota bacterium]
MKVTFRETMSGATDDGRRFAFHVEVEAPRLSSLALAEVSRVRGTVELEGITSHAPIEGTLLIGLPWKPVLEYELEFRGDDGARWRFSGKKSVALTHPVTTMTTLPGTLYRDGEEAARCRLQFALADLPALLTSVRVASAASTSPEQLVPGTPARAPAA